MRMPKPTATTPSRGKSVPSTANPALTAQHPQLSRFQSFTIQRLTRDQLTGAPYNPRRISEVAKKRLKQNLEQVGLVEALVWNRRTGHLVSGHRRLSLLDALEGSHNYALDVAVVDLDLKTEKAQNVFLNNPHAQGTFDPDAMVELLKDTDAPSLLSMGLTRGELELEVGQFPELLEALGVKDSVTDAAKAAADAVSAVKLASKDQQKEQKGQGTSSASSADDDSLVKRRRAEFQDADYTDPARDTEYYLMLRFPSGAAKDAWLLHLGLPGDMRTLDEALFAAYLAPEFQRPTDDEEDDAPSASAAVATDA